MKIGFIVDGEAEFRSLPLLYPKVDTPHQLMNPLRADIQPYASVEQIASAVKKRLPILINRGAEIVIVLIDREHREVCSGQWAQEIAAIINAKFTTVKVGICSTVVKNCCFENWLVSDISAL